MNTSGPKELQFELPSLTIAAKQWGNPKGLPLLALHGWLDNANSFDRIAPLLEGINLVALDLAGHGRSGHRPPGASYYLWDHVADLAEVVRQLGWRRFALMGHSMGAGIATWYAGAFPRQIERLLLIDGFGAPFSVATEQFPKHLGRAIRRMQMSKDMPIERFEEERPQFETFEEAIAERRNGKYGYLSDTAAALLLQRALKPVPGGFRWRNDPRLILPAFLEPNEDIIHAFIQRIQAPALLLLGEQGLFGQGEKAERLQHFQHLEVQKMPGSHHLHLETAAPEVARRLQKFITPSLQPITS